MTFTLFYNGESYPLTDEEAWTLDDVLNEEWTDRFHATVETPEGAESFAGLDVADAIELALMDAREAQPSSTSRSVTVERF